MRLNVTHARGHVWYVRQRGHPEQGRVHDSLLTGSTNVCVLSWVTSGKAVFYQVHVRAERQKAVITLFLSSWRRIQYPLYCVPCPLFMPFAALLAFFGIVAQC